MLRTAFASTYPPRRCGIASFTSDLSSEISGREIVAIESPGDDPRYDSSVRHVIRQGTLADYYHAAWELNRCGVDVVSVQHEFGIWGGNAGTFVLDFVNQLRVPAVVTFHTVLRRPSPEQREAMTGLASLAAGCVVMSHAAALLLSTTYGVNPGRVTVIPHGVPGLPLISSDEARTRLGLGPGPIILSFGLLGPGKGYESVIEAIPPLVAEVPDATYVVLGATHPDVVRRDGESYRHRLRDLATALGVAEHVRFVDRYVSLGELGAWLAAADVFVTPYPNLDQIVSGTLAYAMGAGKAIVSTPYAYAAEMLAEGRGWLVEPGSHGALAEAFVTLLSDDALRARHGRAAFQHSRTMLWPRVGAAYEALLSSVADVPMRAAGGVGASHA